MAPDIEELIKKVNTLTLDKNRLRQKLTHLTQNSGQPIPKESVGSLTQLVSTVPNSQINHPKINCEASPKSSKDSTINKSPSFTSSSTSKALSLATIAGVECSTSCEEDLLFLNELYRKRLDEYSENWDYLQSKCTSLLSELNALQHHYAFLKKEKLDLEEKYKSKCDECDKINGELQTVALNYETQLSAMSEHLSMLTSRVSIDDD